jgi:hypothetical protein
MFKIAYTGFMPEEKTEAEAKIAMWQRFFEKTSYKDAEWAAQRCIESCIYQPTIADMKQYLGMGLTRQDLEARQYLPFDPTKVYYPSDIKIESSFERAMRMLNEPMEKENRDEA